MSKRAQTYFLVGLLAFLAFVLYRTYFGQSEDATGTASIDAKFQPLDIREPQLRLDLLAKLQKNEYSGTHRNIFLAAPPPPPSATKAAAPPPRPVGPMPPPPPPPLQVPVEFFGYETSSSGKRIAFFTSGDDVLVVPEGDSFLMSRFRLVHIDKDTADVQEIASSRHASLQMVQPPPGQSAAQ
jgi:hypothetical protein